MSAHLVEVFSSVQGEGPELGTSTLFVRFAECDLRCSWCDTPHSWLRGARCRFEQERGSGRFEERANPVPLAALIAEVERLELPRHRWLSLTGGEPLLQPEAVRELAQALRGRGPGIWLETHGLHATALAQVLPFVDCVSMDWKLARTCGVRASRSTAMPLHAALRVPGGGRGAARVVRLVGDAGEPRCGLDEAFERIVRTHPPPASCCSP
jgi:pyruvate-formate lyase-activating enzyme